MESPGKMDWEEFRARMRALERTGATKEDLYQEACQFDADILARTTFAERTALYRRWHDETDDPDEVAREHAEALRLFEQEVR